MGRKTFYIAIGVVFGLILLGVLVSIIYGVISGNKTNIDDNEQQYLTEEIEIEGEKVYVDEEDKNIHEFIESWNLTEDEEKTILKNRVERVVEPFEHENRLYVFYDREQLGSQVLVEIVEDYVKETNIPYTVYHMNNEDGLVNGTIVLNKMGFEYNLADENRLMLVLIKEKEIVGFMTSDTLSETELKRW